MKPDLPVSYRLDPGARVAGSPFKGFDELTAPATFTPDWPGLLLGVLVLDGDEAGQVCRVAEESAWWLRWWEDAA